MNTLLLLDDLVLDDHADVNVKLDVFVFISQGVRLLAMDGESGLRTGRGRSRSKKTRGGGGEKPYHHNHCDTLCEL